MLSHRDLIPPNTLVADGRLVGVLDVGGLGRPIPLSIWCARDAEWQRGRAWAFEQAVGAVRYYVNSSPAMSVGCQRTLERIVADMRS